MTLLLLTALIALAPAGLASGNSSSGGPSYQPVLGTPATSVDVIGASPGQASGEAWAQGYVGAVPATVGGQKVADELALLQYTDAAGSWQVVPLDDASGSPIALRNPSTSQQGWAASAVTPNGGVAVIGDDSAGQVLVTKDPASAFAPAPVPAGSVLLNGESLFGSSNVPVMSAFDESSGTGVFIAPSPEATNTPGVLHYLDGTWTREPICSSYTGGRCAAVPALSVAAISASSSTNAWLIGTSAANTPGPGPLLFERTVTAQGTTVWLRQSVSSFPLGSGGAPFNAIVRVPGSGPILTATGSGVWIDLAINGQTDATVFVSGAGTTASSTAIQGTWCYPASLCPAATGSLGGDLPSGYGSFAWTGASATTPGTRVITGLDQAAELQLTGGASSFDYAATSGDANGVDGGGATFGPGGETLTQLPGQPGGGAAFASPSDGWLGSALPVEDPDPELVQVTTTPGTGDLTAWPVPFSEALLAIAGEPGTTPDGTNAEAFAVGENGEVAQYQPTLGWVPEYLYNGAGVVQTPTLRAVAWPSANTAFAVGDNGAMWVWNGQTNLWEPDPAKPIGFQGNLSAIAFDPTDPEVGFAVGKQGVLLGYDKTWTQQILPSSVAGVNFTSVAFAGSEAIAGYSALDPDDASAEEGGILDETSTGWSVDPSAQSVLSTLPAQDTVISKVAGLPDGGAVAAGPDVVLERQSAGAAWTLVATPLAESSDGNIAALAAFRDAGGNVEALLSVDTDPISDPSGTEPSLWQQDDNPPAVSAGQPPLLLPADPMSSSGYLLRQTSSGWSELEFDDPTNQLNGAGGVLDLPSRPDPVLALWTDSSGQQGWEVGGQTGGDLQLLGPSNVTYGQTAGIGRIGAGPSPPTSAQSPITVPSGQATFAFGGDAGCLSPCSGNAAQSPGPEAWLGAAVSGASQISGLRAFLSAGQPISSTANVPADTFDRELAYYRQSLGQGATPVYAVPTSVTEAYGASTFAGILGSDAPIGTSPSGTPAPPAGTAAYAFDSTGSQGGTVRVIILDFSSGTLSPAQLSWLTTELNDARRSGIAALVAGSDNITDSTAPNHASDGAQVESALLSGGASAYLFYDATATDAENVAETIGTGSNTIPAYGTGTLGYVTPPQDTVGAQDFHGASGYLLVSVNTQQLNGSTGRAPVSVQLIPNVGQLAIDALGGTQLHRSSVSLFEGLGRRPNGGELWIGNNPSGPVEAPDPYTILPETCVGSDCNTFVAPAYNFTSSNPSVGSFVAHDPTSVNPLQIELDAQGKPVPDAASGLFCAFNPGTTTVTISAGGQSYSLPVAVLGGSVRAPCGTVTVTQTQTTTNPTSTVPSITTSPRINPGPIRIQLPTPPSTPAPTPVPVPKAVVAVRPPPTVLQAVPPAGPVAPRALFPVAALTPRPTPPTGFSSVIAPAPVPGRVFEEEREEETATESAQAFAAYEPDAPNPLVPATSVLVVLAVLGMSGATIRRRGRPGRRIALARAELRNDPRPWGRRSGGRRYR